jgi:transcriptional regulator with XRE-family HTH domain
MEMGAKTASQLLHERYFKHDPQAEEVLHQTRTDFQVSILVHEARIAAGLSQEELATLIGTRKSAISRLEDADYKGHSLAMLRRIAEALDLELRIELVPRNKKKAAPAKRAKAQSEASVPAVREESPSYGRRPRKK